MFPFLPTKKRSDAPAAGARAPKQAPLKKGAEEVEVDPTVRPNSHILIRPHGAVFEPLAVGMVIGEEMVPEVQKSSASMGIQNLSQPHRRPRQARQGHLLWRVGFNCASRTGIIHPGAQKLTSSFMGCTIHKILPEGPRTSEKAMVDLGLRGRGGHALRGSPIAPVQGVESLQSLHGLGVRRQAEVSPTYRGPAPAIVRTPRLTQGRERG